MSCMCVFKAFHMPAKLHPIESFPAASTSILVHVCHSRDTAIAAIPGRWLEHGSDAAQFYNPSELTVFHDVPDMYVGGATTLSAALLSRHASRAILV